MRLFAVEAPMRIVGTVVNGLLIAGVSLLILPSKARSDEGDIARTTADGMRQSRSAIRTIYAKVDVVVHPPRGAPPAESDSAAPLSFEFWQEGEVFRYRAIRRLKGTEEWLYKDNLLKRLITDERLLGDQKAATFGRRGVIGPTKNAYDGIENLWSICLFEHPLFRDHRPLSQMLAAPYFQSISSVERGGRKLLCAKFRVPTSKPDDRDDELWIDPRRNYLVERLVHHRAPVPSSNISGDYEVEVQEAREVVPGVFFPTRVESRQYDKDMPVPLFNWSMMEVQINQAIKPEIFELRFPKGTQVGDLVKQTVYEVGEDEQPTGQQLPLLKPQVDNIAPTKFATGDPRHPWRLISLVTAAVAALACIGWIARRRLQRV
jgi:hypothetical protein